MAPLDERGTAQLDILVKVQSIIRPSCRQVLMFHEFGAVSEIIFQICVCSQGFSRQSFLLFKILSSVRNHQINSDLAQLLLRLDYNKYYTQSGGTLGR